MSSVWGKNLKISIFGQSHGAGIGVVMDGFPAGIKIDMDNVLFDMARRAPGGIKGATTRVESDFPKVMSGIFEGITTGSPICAVIENTSQRSRDYSELENKPRPGHADFTAFYKYSGFADMRGGGHFSGRLTAPLVFAGGIARAYLQEKGIIVGSHILSIGKISDEKLDAQNVDAKLLRELREKTPSVISVAAYERMQEYISTLEGDSVGGVIECAAIGVPIGIGNPMFEGVESVISSILFGIPAVKGVEFGRGFDISETTGSDANDEMFINDGKIMFKSNNCGGVLGGITCGTPLIVRVAVKPTPSISLEQDTINFKTQQNVKLKVKGRHDACIALRIPPVIEAAVMIALADMSLNNY